MVVERTRLHPELGAEAPHRQVGQAVPVEHEQGPVDDVLTAVAHGPDANLNAVQFKDRRTPMASNRRTTTTDLALVAAFAALIAVCALLPAIELGIVDITLQTFAVMLAGAVLGARRGFLAALLYVAVGCAGLPVFSQGGAGLATLAGPSGGYLVGFPLAAGLAGLVVERLPRQKLATSVPLIFLAGLAGSFAFIHPLGIAGLVTNAGLTWTEAFRIDLAFWPGDAIKNLAMAVVATAVHRAFPDLLGRRTSSRATQHTPTAA